MKSLFSRIKFFYFFLRKRYDTINGIDDVFIDEKKPNILAQTLNILFGNIYHYLIMLIENYKILKFRVEEELKDHKIIIDLLKHTRSILFYSIAAIIFSSLLDWSFWQLYPSISRSDLITSILVIPSHSTISSGLQVFIGGISAILGLIFALFAVGFQLFTDRYSEDVTIFINEEKVGNYFFSFLIFTDIFSILVLIKLFITPQLPLISFIIAFVFVFISISGILVFKKHYMNSLKPKSLLSGLWRRIKDKLDIVSNQNSYKESSWSLVINARKSVNRYLNIIGNIYRDLVNNNKVNEAAYAPLFLGYILQDYTNVKRFIDMEKGWWPYETYEKVKASNTTMYAIKANYEIESKGPLFIPTLNKNWFEDKILQLLKEMSKLTNDHSNQMIINVVSGLKLILVGDFQKQVDAPPSIIPGSLQNQEFEIFDSTMDLFLNLWNKIDFSDKNLATEFINAYFQIAEAIIQPFDTSKAEKEVDNFYTAGNQLNYAGKFRKDKNIPAYNLGLLTDFWERLEVEQKLEHNIVTPKERLKEQINDMIKAKHKEVVMKNLDLLYDNSSKIILNLLKNRQPESAAHFIVMQYEWINRLIFLDEEELAGYFSEKIQTSTKLLIYLPKHVAADAELLENIEKGYFMSLIHRNKKMFAAFVKSLIIIMTITKEEDKSKTDEILRSIRMPAFWGGLAYLVSEFDQDFYYVGLLSQELELIYIGGDFPSTINAIVELKQIKNIMWESTRYHSWYMHVLNKLDHDLRKEVSHDPGEIGFEETYIHPSIFIRGLSNWIFLGEDKCLEGFASWVEKRNEIKKIISLLKRWGNI